MRWWVGAAFCAVLLPPRLVVAQDVVPPRVGLYAELTAPCDSALVASRAARWNLTVMPRGYACYGELGGIMVWALGHDDGTLYPSVLAGRNDP